MRKVNHDEQTTEVPSSRANEGESPNCPCLFDPHNQRWFSESTKALCRAPAEICTPSTANGRTVANVGSQNTPAVSSSCDGSRPNDPSQFQPQDMTDPSRRRARDQQDYVQHVRETLFLPRECQPPAAISLTWLDKASICVGCEHGSRSPNPSAPWRPLPQANNRPSERRTKACSLPLTSFLILESNDHRCWVREYTWRSRAR